jgi:pentatricopeptide repeat protein
MFSPSLVTAYGDLGDASSAIWLFAKFAPSTTRTWNVLLGTLAKIAEHTETYEINTNTSSVAVAFQSSFMSPSNTGFQILLQETNIFETVHKILRGMCQQEKINGITAPSADSQTFCVAASALQYGPAAGSILANALFQTATKLCIPADGRFVNAAVRCFGNDIDAALAAWRDSIRPKCIAFDKRALSASLSSGTKNLVAAYNGLLYVCGRALRPDIALRVVYAMNKDGIEPNETSLNSYRSGTRIQQKVRGRNNEDGDAGMGLRSTIERTLKLREQFESLLVVECTKYDQNDRRRDGEQRVRIIL